MAWRDPRSGLSLSTMTRPMAARQRTTGSNTRSAHGRHIDNQPCVPRATSGTVNARRASRAPQGAAHEINPSHSRAASVIIAASVNTLPYSLVTAKGITKWADLKGKKVGISRFGSGVGHGDPSGL